MTIMSVNPVLFIKDRVAAAVGSQTTLRILLQQFPHIYISNKMYCIGLVVLYERETWSTCYVVKNNFIYGWPRTGCHVQRAYKIPYPQWSLYVEAIFQQEFHKNIFLAHFESATKVIFIFFIIILHRYTNILFIWKCVSLFIFYLCTTQALNQSCLVTTQFDSWFLIFI